MRRALGSLLAGLLLLAAAACARQGDPVRGLLDTGVKRAEARDAAGLVALLSSDFRAEDGSGPAEVEATLKRYFLAYESLSVRLSDVTIERAPEVAQVAFRASLSGTPRTPGLAGLLPNGSAWRFDLRLVKETAGWHVAQAAWKPVAGS